VDTTAGVAAYDWLIRSEMTRIVLYKLMKHHETCYINLEKSALVLAYRHVS